MSLVPSELGIANLIQDPLNGTGLPDALLKQLLQSDDICYAL